MSYNNNFNEIPDYKLKEDFLNLLGLDYHQVLRNKMEELIQEIKKK